MFDQGTGIGTDESSETSVPAWQRLHGEMKSATRRRSAWDAEHARHLREAEAMQLWNHFGYISILEYLEREHGIEPRTACDRLRVSHALADLPMLEAELEDGTFQYSHVKELTRVVTPETEDEWITAAKGKTCGEVQAMVAGRKKGDGPDDPEDPDLRPRNWSVPMTPQMEAMFRTRRVELEKELGHRLEEIEVWRSILERAGECREGASTPAQISICSHCNRGWQDGAGRRAELHPADLEYAMCDGEHLGSVDGEPARKKQSMSKRKRERIMARDGHRCAVPGCRSARNLDVHHMRHRKDGGGNEDWNLITLCSGHHRMHHRGALAIEGRAPDAIQFTWTGAAEEERVHEGTNENRVVREVAKAEEGPSNRDQREIVNADGHASPATIRAHAGTNESQRLHAGTNESQRPHAGTNESHARSERGRPRDAPARSSKFSIVALRTQARAALVGLGWKTGIAGPAVDDAIAHVGTDVRIEKLISEALRRCPKPLG